MEVEHVVVFVNVLFNNSKYLLFNTAFHLNKFVFKHNIYTVRQ